MKPSPTRPTALTRGKRTPLRELPPRPGDELFLNPGNAYLRRYELGECIVIVTREGGMYHLSISHRRRYPSWDEIVEAWYRTVPGAEGRVGAMVLPPLRLYLNVDENCMQVHEIDGAEFREGP